MKLADLSLFLLPFAIACTPMQEGTSSDDDDAVADDDDAAFSCDGITPEVTDLSSADLDGMLDAKDFELINVHIPRQGEIPGTDVHIAYTDTDGLESHLGGDLGAKAVLYCRTGPMSAIASQALVDLGYCRIFDLPGAMAGWEAEGYPLDD